MHCSLKELALAVYPAIGGPGIANECFRRHGSKIENEAIFPLWKKLISSIENKCGRYICDVLTKSIIDDIEIPELFDDQSIMTPLINQFCLALDIAGSVLNESYTMPELRT